jgi:DNA invertase Pin-like site-specific DNA recombinase
MQKHKLEAMSVVKGAELIETIVDSDASAKSLERPGMQRLLEMIARGEVDIVAIYKLDRLTRNVGDLNDLLKIFAKMDVSLVSVVDSLDTNSASGRLVLNIMTSVSSWERETIGERTTSVLQHIKSQGFPAGPPAFGYSSQPRTAAEKELKIRKPLLENPEEQKIMARITDLHAQKKSWPWIAHRLNHEGHRTRSGGEWVYQAVHRIYTKVIMKREKVAA